MYYKKDKMTTVLLCLCVGVFGVHFIYLQKMPEFKVRLVWFIFCNPVAFIKTMIDLYRLLKMNQYQFDVYTAEKVEGSGTRAGLHETLNKIEKKNY